MRKDFLNIICFFFIAGHVAAQDTTIILDSGTITETAYDDNTSNFDTINKEEIIIVPERMIADSALDKLYADKDFWYANKSFANKKDTRQNSELPFWYKLATQTWFKALIWIIIILSFVTILIWYLAVGNIRLFQRPSSSIATINEDYIPDDIFSIDYEKEINKAIEAKNYRLAIRLYYLLTLKNLSEVKLIEYREDKTDSDYVFQLSGTKHYDKFFKLTRSFEYVWYGKFELRAGSFDILKKEFSNFNQQWQ